MGSDNSELDATTASMSTVELNNMVVRLRKPIKYAKTVVIKKLAKQAKRYLEKKGSEEQLKANRRRAEHLQEQITVLDKYKADKITKFCLTSKLTFGEIANKGSPEERALTRIADQKLIKKKVSEWRQKHSDWEILAAHLNSQVSRRHRNKKAAIIKTETVMKLTEKHSNTENKDGEEEMERKLENELEAHRALQFSVDSDSECEIDDSEEEESDAEESQSDDSNDENVHEVLHKEKPIVSKNITEDKKPEKNEQDCFFEIGEYLEDNNSKVEPSKSNSDESRKRKGNFNNQNSSKFAKKQSNASPGFMKKQSAASTGPVRKQSNASPSSVKNQSCYRNKTSTQPTEIKRNNTNESKTKESLHPSWAAKKKDKERNFITFQSNRIVFDD